MVQNNLTVSVPEAGRLLGIGRNLSYRLAQEGKLPILRCGKRVRVSLSALERMIDNCGQLRTEAKK